MKRTLVLMLVYATLPGGRVGAAVLHVRTNGNDLATGLSWPAAKATVGAWRKPVAGEFWTRLRGVREPLRVPRPLP